MRTTSRQFARRATALLTSALLVMPLFPASAFASEQEELAPQVEETIVEEESSENSTETTEVDAVVEADENANESAVGESDDAEATVAEENATLTTASGEDEEQEGNAPQNLREPLGTLGGTTRLTGP